MKTGLQSTQFQNVVRSRFTDDTSIVWCYYWLIVSFVASSRPPKQTNKQSSKIAESWMVLMHERWFIDIHQRYVDWLRYRQQTDSVHVVRVVCCWVCAECASIVAVSTVLDNINGQFIFHTSFIHGVFYRMDVVRVCHFVVLKDSIYMKSACNMLHTSLRHASVKRHILVRNAAHTFTTSRSVLVAFAADCAWNRVIQNC